MRSRSTARTATRTSSPSSATCGTRRRPSSTRVRASSTRSSRPITPSATAKIGPFVAKPCVPRASSACRPRSLRRPAARDRRLRGVTPGELRTLATLASTFVPAADGERIAGLAAEALSRAADPAQVTQLRLVLRALELAPTNGVMAGRWQAFGRLDQPARERVLLAWSTSPIPQQRAAFGAFKRLLSFLAYADPGLPETPNPLPGFAGYDPDRPPVTADLTPIQPLDVDRSHSATSDPIELTADVVIVGSGAGGGVVAAELAKAGRPAGILDAGPFVAQATSPRSE